MKEKLTVEEIQSYFNAFNEKITILGDQNIADILNEIRALLIDIHDENSYKTNYLMVRLKKETAIGYQAMEKLMELGLVHYDGKHFDFRSNFLGVTGSFFAYVGFSESKTLSEFVTHKGRAVAPGTFQNGKKNTPTREWCIIEKMLNNQNLTRK